MKKRGVSLLTVIFILLIIIVLIGLGINIAKKGFDESILGETIKVLDPNKKTEDNKFSIETLEENGIGTNATIEQLKNKFGELKQTASYVKTTTGENVEEYSKSGVKVILKNSKLYLTIITENGFEFNGVKIGDTESKVLNSFYQEKETGEVINSQNEVIGKYIYGSYNIDNLKDMKVKDKIQYAYIGNEKTAYEGLYDYVIQYAYMEPPYEKEYASENDKVVYIEFGIKDGVVKSFASQIGK